MAVRARGNKSKLVNYYYILGYRVNVKSYTFTIMGSSSFRNFRIINISKTRIRRYFMIEIMNVERCTREVLFKYILYTLYCMYTDIGGVESGRLYHIIIIFIMYEIFFFHT